MDEFIPWYPSVSDPRFVDLLWKKKEFFELRNLHDEFLYPHQMFIQRFMSPETPYDRLLLFHNPGSGKTFSSIAVTESHKHLRKRALILVKGDTSSDNFRDQLEKWYKSKDYNMNNIEKYYEIRKYISFSNFLRKMTDAQIKSTFGNRVIIIDEVHNLKSSFNTDKDSVYDQIWRLLHLVEGCKILLLSATPMIDRAEEIYSIFNLLLDKEAQMDHRTEEKEFKNRIRGMVSYLMSKDKMANVIEVGETLEKMNIKVIPSYMEGHQLVAYNKIDMKNIEDHVYRNSIYCSLMTFEDGSYGSEAFNRRVKRVSIEKNRSKYVFLEPTRSSITMDTLSSYSCKYATMIKIIESEPQSLIFIFCEEVKGSGLIMIGCILDALGYELYEGDEIDEDFEKKPRYTLYTGDSVACPNPEERLRGFRSPLNKYGEYVRILIGSKVSGEGINLVNVRQVHVITPHWNSSVVEQAIGRAIRRDSHTLLLEDERVITVYRHVAIANKTQLSWDPSNSIDMYKYRISEDKAKMIVAIENIMKQASIDYYLNIDRTTTKKWFGKDLSTYLVGYLDKKIVDKIKELFKNQHTVPLGDIGTEKRVYLAMVAKGITIDGKRSVKEKDGILYLDPPVVYDLKKISIDTFCRKSFDSDRSDIILEKFSDKKSIISFISKLDIESKTKFLEKAITFGNKLLLEFFGNSIIQIDNTWYHILLYRTAEDNYSYAIPSESFKASGRTRVLLKRWQFVQDAKVEQEVINKITVKSKDAAMPMEQYGMYAIFSNADNKFRIRNSVVENREKAAVDSRRVNRGRCIDSYDLSRMREILMHILIYQIDPLQRRLLVKNCKPDPETLLDFFLGKNFVLGNTGLNDDDLAKLILSGSYDFVLLYWVMTKRRANLIDTIVNLLINNNMYIIR